MMRRISHLCGGALVLGLLFSPAHAADTTLFRTVTPETANLDGYRWQHRPVVIFAPSAQDPAYLEQMAILQNSQAELTERDIVVLSDTSPAANGKLRSQLQPQGFELVLVGKDGGMKLRETTPLSSEVLLSTIDKMPMRKANRD